jgi:hypothetical protein
MNDQWWAWLAGLYEGEGSLAFTGRNSVFLYIASTDKDVVERTREVAGVGYVRLMRAAEPTRKELWAWQVGHKEDILKVLAEIEPYLGARRGQRVRDAQRRLQRCRTIAHKGVMP